MEKIKLDAVVIVEGKYDKIKLSSFLDATIIETNGFRIFKEKKQLEMIRTLAAKKGLIVMTDSDGAGFVIRRYLSGPIPKEQIRHVYIPDILGKEKRKDRPSKEGKLGVEGISQEVLLEALRKAGVFSEENNVEHPPITAVDLMELGLSAGEESALRRKRLYGKLNLPEHLSSKAFLQVLNSLMTLDELQALVEEIRE